MQTSVLGAFFFLAAAVALSGSTPTKDHPDFHERVGKDGQSYICLGEGKREMCHATYPDDNEVYNGETFTTWHKFSLSTRYGKESCRAVKFEGKGWYYDPFDWKWEEMPCKSYTDGTLR